MPSRVQPLLDAAVMLSNAERLARLTRIDALWLELMKRGRFERAWQLSDEALRLRAGLECDAWPRHQQFIWNGESLERRRVLVRCYHGLGDTIQYARFVPMLRAIGAESVLWAQPRLIPLLQTMRGIGTVMPLHDGVPDADCDADVELAELMHVFRVTPQSLAAHVPYLNVGTRRAKSCSGVTTIGLVWRSGDWDTRRCIPTELLAPLTRLGHVCFRILQRGPERERWPRAFELEPAFDNVIDEARAMLQLDLLITVDTFAAHLGGALGVPVWLLLHSDPDWRWMRTREDTPWYPTMRLFRQKRSGDWQAVLQNVCAALESSAASLTSSY